MINRFGIDAAVFAIKAYLAAMLSLYAALAIGLERPYWAFLTSYIVAQPLAGAVVSKAVFRAIGTFVGALVAVALVPLLVNSPELLTLAISLWLAICVFVSLLDRTPRSYMFVLAGYTAIVIALPSVDDPASIFSTASYRVQEIMLGIVSGSIVHALVLPRSVSDFLFARLDAILDDAERWSKDSLNLQRDENLARDRRRLALDVTELHQLSIHLPFESSRIAPRIRTVRALQDQLSQILPLGAAVADRIAQIQARGGLPRPVSDLLLETQDWLEAMHVDRETRNDRAEMLISRSADLEPMVRPNSPWSDYLSLSLLARLAILIAAHRDTRDLVEQLHSPDRRPVTPRIVKLLEGRRRRELHADVASAMTGAAGAAITMIVGSALWIASGWENGGTAVMLAGVFLALFAGSDNPLVPMRGFLLGTLCAIVLGAVYAFAVLPRLDGFPELAAAFAPPLLLLGALMSNPRFAGIALATLLGLGSPVLLAQRYQADFAGFVNGSIAQIAGIMFAIAMTRLLRSAGVDGAIGRTLKAGWRDIAERSTLTTPPDLRGWIARMVDRVALLAPRLSASGRAPDQPIYDALRDMRTGIAIGELRQLRADLAPDETQAMATILADTGRYFQSREPDRAADPPPALLHDIDEAMRTFAGHEDKDVRRTALLALISLRRNLFPEATAMGLQSA